MLSPQMIQQGNQITGMNVGASSGAGGSASRATEIRAMGQSAAPAAPSAQPAAPAPKLGSDSLGIGQYAGNAIKNQAESGVNQMEQSYQDAKTATNPLTKLEAGMGMVAGGIGAATSPIAPVLA